jgi:hypothetical protein
MATLHVKAAAMRGGIAGAGALWYAVVWLGNLADLLRARGALPAAWPWVSGNHGMVHEAVDRFAPAWVAEALFAGVLLAEGLVAGLLAWAVLGPATARRGRLDGALAAGALLWAAFLIADDLFVCFRFAPTHLGLLSVHLLAWQLVRAED